MNNISKFEKIPSRDIYYFRQRQKNKVFQSVLAYFADRAERENFTKKELAYSLSKDPAQITRWFSGPNNWTLDTISDLLLAMNAEMKYEIVPIDNNQIKSEILKFDRNQISFSGIDPNRTETTNIYEVGSA